MLKSEEEYLLRSSTPGLRGGDYVADMAPPGGVLSALLYELDNMQSLLSPTHGNLATAYSRAFPGPMPGNGPMQGSKATASSDGMFGEVGQRLDSLRATAQELHQLSAAYDARLS